MITKDPGVEIFSQSIHTDFAPLDVLDLSHSSIWEKLDDFIHKTVEEKRSSIP